MSAVNPYMPPSAQVADVVPSGEDFLVPTILTWRGRIGRLRYLAYATGAAIIMWLSMIPLSVLAAVTKSVMLIGVFYAIAGIVLSIFFAMTAIQRLHDLDWSGWLWILLWVPVVNLIFGLMLIFMPGTDATNRFGPRPSPHGWGVVVLGCIAPLFIVAFIGIMAAVALPAYQTYVTKAKAAVAAKP